MIQPEIQEAQNLYEEYQLDRALQSLDELSQEQLEGLPIEIQLRFHMLKGEIIVTMQNYVKAVPSAEKAYEIVSKYNEFRDSIERIDAFLLFAEVLMKTSKFEKCNEILKEVDTMLTKLPAKLNRSKKKRRAERIRIQAGVYWNSGRDHESVKMKEELHEIYSELEDWNNLAANYNRIGWTCYLAGDMDGALKNCNKSKKILEKMEVSLFFKTVEAYNLLLYGEISSHRGELIEALKYQEEALTIAKEYRLLDQWLWILLNIGITYMKLADWEKAILYFSKSLQMAENLQIVYAIARNLARLVEANLNTGDIKAAESHLERLRKINTQNSNKIIDQSVRLSEAFLLRKSTRTRDLGKAQENLQEISKEKIVQMEITTKAMINLCEMLVLEFKDSKAPEVLTELNPLLTKLVTMAESKQSYWIMAETLLLKAKVATISLNLTEARHSINQAQIIAEKHGLKNLAIKISRENDNLIKNLAVFEQMKLENDPIESRLEKINLEEQINDMLHKNKFTIPELNDEDPVLLMIMAPGGVPLYTHVFKDGWNVDDHLFSGFLSAFNSFSDEIFSKGFDRAVFGDYSILMNSMDNFKIAYIFLGPSYLAKQRFTQFTDKMQNSATIQEKLKLSDKSGRVLHPNEMPELEAQIQELFVPKESIM